MNIATLRLEGPTESLSELKRQLGLQTDAEWRAGAKRRDGIARNQSGFNSTIADSETATGMTGQLQTFLTKCDAAGITFPWRGISGEMDIGFSVGDTES